MPFGFPGRAGRVEDVQHVLGVHALRLARRRRVGHQLMPPVIAPVLHAGERVVVDAAVPALDDDDVLDRRALFERLVGVPLERHERTAAIAAVGRDEQLRLRVVDAIAQRFGRESAEHHRVNRADARAGEHRDRHFGHERHVDRHSIASLDAELLQNVRELLDFDVQVPVRQRAAVAGLSFPDERRLVAARSGHVAVDAIHRDVELSTNEPFRVRRLPLADRFPLLEPLELTGLGRPERLRRLVVESRIGHERAAAKAGRRRELAVFVEECVDLGHGLPKLRSGAKVE